MFTEFDFRICHLQRLRWIGRKKQLQWLKQDPQLKNLYQLTPLDVQAIFSLSPERANEVYSDLQSTFIKKSIENDLNQYHVISIQNTKYPELLKSIPDPPLLLYALGDISYLNAEPKISVIGTRNYSSEAFSKVRYIVRPLIEQNWVIVSGMARGIDTMAHQTAIELRGKTIAVLGFGFRHIYPKENRTLMKNLAQQQLLLSEYPPDVPPRKWHFPERNRIISGLSFGCLIIEAKEKSGTFITAEQALEQGRDVFVVPGSIFLEQTKGCHQLLKEGAELIDHPNDLLKIWEERKPIWS